MLSLKKKYTDDIAAVRKRLGLGKGSAGEAELKHRLASSPGAFSQDEADFKKLEGLRADLNVLEGVYKNRFGGQTQPADFSNLLVVVVLFFVSVLVYHWKKDSWISKTPVNLGTIEVKEFNLHPSGVQTAVVSFFHDHPEYHYDPGQDLYQFWRWHRPEHPYRVRIFTKYYKTEGADIFPLNMEYKMLVPKETSDKAMMVLVGVSEIIRRNGGIDLNTTQMKFSSIGEMDRAVLQQSPNIRPQDIIGISIEGVTVMPIPSLPKLLGLDDPDDPLEPQEPLAQMQSPYWKEERIFAVS